MNIKIHSSEISKMMKVISPCINPKNPNFSNIEISHNNNLLTIRGTDHTTSAVIFTPALGGDGETFCVDGTLFARVIGMCNGEVIISTDDKNCTIKGAGRTRLPIINASIPAFKKFDGKKITVNAGDFTKCFNAVAYAVASDQNRPVLTGVLVTSNAGQLEMVALDGFQMAIETTGCVGDDLSVVVPNAFMKLISSNTAESEQLHITVKQGLILAETESMMISCSLLTGDYPDKNRILPESFATKIMIDAESLRNALKCGSVVNESNNLVKLVIGENVLSITSNSEQADFEADMFCDTQGDPLSIAFNQKYLISTIGSITAKELVLNFNSAVSPCIINGRNENGIHLVLPVRTLG